MGNVFPAYSLVHPSFMEPETILQYTQRSGAFDLLAGDNPRTKISTEDQYVYIKTLELRTQTQTGQAAGNSLPSASLMPGMISTPAYMIRTRAEYDHLDVAAAGRWDVALPEAYRLAGRQGIFQQMRNLLLYGRFPSNGEGLLNQANATNVTLPPDSNGNATIMTYDNGQMSLFVLALISAIQVRMFQLGQPNRISICGPQRVLVQWMQVGIVQVTQFQRPGAGTSTTSQVVEAILQGSGNRIDWSMDDTLIGKGAGGTDAVIFTIPEIHKPVGQQKLDTGDFNDLQPGLDACVLQYMDMAAPREITAPLAGGAVDIVFENKCTSGWAPRPEAVTVLSAQYS